MENIDGERVTRRRSSKEDQDQQYPQSISWKYPKECNICKKERVQYNNKILFPVSIVTFDAQDKCSCEEERS